MALRASTSVEAFGNGNGTEHDYHRVYVPTEVREDSEYELSADQEVVCQILPVGLVILPSRQASLAEEIATLVREEVV